MALQVQLGLQVRKAFRAPRAQLALPRLLLDPLARQGLPAPPERKVLLVRLAPQVPRACKASKAPQAQLDLRERRVSKALRGQLDRRVRLDQPAGRASKVLQDRQAPRDLRGQQARLHLFPAPQARLGPLVVLDPPARPERRDRPALAERVVIMVLSSTEQIKRQSAQLLIMSSTSARRLNLMVFR